jgi:hypothetical protein
MTNSEASFTTIESAQEFLSLLGEAIDTAIDEVHGELSRCTIRRQQRRVEAWQIVLCTTKRLASHVAVSRRLLNDLRTLRNIMHRTGAVEHPESTQMSADMFPVDYGEPAAQVKV